MAPTKRRGSMLSSSNLFAGHQAPVVIQESTSDREPLNAPTASPEHMRNTRVQRYSPMHASVGTPRPTFPPVTIKAPQAIPRLHNEDRQPDDDRRSRSDSPYVPTPIRLSSPSPMPLLRAVRGDRSEDTSLYEPRHNSSGSASPDSRSGLENLISTWQDIARKGESGQVIFAPNQEIQIAPVLMTAEPLQQGRTHTDSSTRSTRSTGEVGNPRSSGEAPGRCQVSPTKVGLRLSVGTRKP